MWKFVLAAALIVATIPARCDAQILSALTRPQIEEAIALGSKPRDARRFLDRYRLRPRALGGNGPIIAVVTTPFARVVALALETHEKYEVLTAAAVPLEALAPEVMIHAGPRRRHGGGPADVANVRAIVLTPHGSKDRADAILPERTEETPATFGNLFGAKWEGVGMTAVFPATRFSTDLDLHIVFDENIEIAGLSRCDDCRIEMKAQRLK